MIVDLSKVKIFIKPGITDMRKQINGLSIIIEEQLHQNIFHGHLYLFCLKKQKNIENNLLRQNRFCYVVKKIRKE